jgi:hypothetical protein
MFNPLFAGGEQISLVFFAVWFGPSWSSLNFDYFFHDRFGVKLYQVNTLATHEAIYLSIYLTSFFEFSSLRLNIF